MATPLPSNLFPANLIKHIKITPNYLIKIDENETADALKDEIKQKNPQALAAIDAAALILYEINAFEHH